MHTGRDQAAAQAVIRAMRRLRSPWVRAFLIWTAALLAVAILLAVSALAGFLRADDECFVGTGPCPQLGDANFTTLAIAVFVIPLVWLVGVLAGALARAIAARRRTGGGPGAP